MAGADIHVFIYKKLSTSCISYPYSCWKKYIIIIILQAGRVSFSMPSPPEQIIKLVLLKYETKKTWLKLSLRFDETQRLNLC